MPDTPQATPDTAPFRWDHVLKKWGPVVEVLPGDAPGADARWNRQLHAACMEGLTLLGGS